MKVFLRNRKRCRGFTYLVQKMAMKSKARLGFTLVELLVVIAIIAVLAALSLPLYRLGMAHANCAGCASHMRTLGLAFDAYANDNNSQLPGRAEGTGVNKWPTLLLDYVQNPAVYADRAIRWPRRYR